MGSFILANLLVRHFNLKFREMRLLVLTLVLNFIHIGFSLPMIYPGMNNGPVQIAGPGGPNWVRRSPADKLARLEALAEKEHKFKRRDKRYAHVIGGLKLEHRKLDDFTNHVNRFLDTTYNQVENAIPLNMAQVNLPKVAGF